MRNIVGYLYYLKAFHDESIIILFRYLVTKHFLGVVVLLLLYFYYFLVMLYFLYLWYNFNFRYPKTL